MFVLAHTHETTAVPTVNEHVWKDIELFERKSTPAHAFHTGLVAPTYSLFEPPSLTKFEAEREQVDSELTAPTANRQVVGHVEDGHERLKKAASDRILLLATKYASDAPSKEIAARLEILGRRLLELDPQVKESQVAALEDMTTQLAAIRQRRNARGLLLGLPAQP